ncbi:MAG: ATP-binding cassette domain-containing protein, partial [Clostridia bacterium]|nr:ATP-binding cassette domain-containing protein [Clostridia bacterium]
QLSGGQMQRVAIARAIVNNPEILLADEPTGALDSETSVQVMDILREIAADRLVIMVTHNPELAREYATRIIRLKDGLVTDDSMPYDREYSEEKLIEKRNRSMSFFTALGLSVNNLLTKKGRTIMTCFAGSIGIIGIALILSVSNGVNVFINKIQEDTLTKYPLTVEAESIDMTSMLEAMQGNAGKNEEKTEHEDGRVYESSGIARMFKSMSSITSLKNNVTDFKKYIEQSEEFNRYVSAIRYRYPVKMNMYYTDADGNIVKSDSESVLRDMYSAMGVSMGGISSAMLRSYSSGLNVWEELLPGKNGSIISETVTEQYDIVYGRWPEAKNEVILILNSNNELSDFVLYAIGLKSSGEFKEILRAAIAGREINTEKKSWSYEEICSRSFRLILPSDAYQKQADGTYVDLSETSEGLTVLYNTADRYLEIKIVGIIRPNSNALFNMLTGAVGYTTGLTEYIIDRTSSSEIVTRQLEDKETDAISGLPFKTDEPAKDDSAKIEAFREFYNALDVSQKSAVARDILLVPSEEYLRNAFDAYVQQMGREGLISRITETYRQSMGITDT